jgi:uncharacterized beta-barrel protein YwiB (DUF1934 family)
MKKEVRITLEGIQAGEKDTVTTQADGVYHYRNGKHYIRYEEVSGDGKAQTINTLKLAPGHIVHKKDGSYGSTQMVFDLMEITRSVYPTPYGSLELQITTSEIVVTEEEDEILTVIRYKLSDPGVVFKNILSQNKLWAVSSYLWISSRMKNCPLFIDS